MTQTQLTSESVSFQRRPEFPGLEVRSVNNSTQPWRGYSADFEFVVPETWQGEVWHRQRHALVKPGSMLCVHPGEVTLARSVLAAGDYRSLCIDESTLHLLLAAYQIAPENVRLRACVEMSPELQQRVVRLLNALSPGADVSLIAVCLAEFVQSIVTELLDPVPVVVGLDRRGRAAQRVRECLSEEASTNLDLASLAQQSGLSRFQALRAFKRRYGLPPHTYQLRVRVGLAQKSLREGLQPARVAAECGFVDQSHMTRHFKRLVGITPAQYARVGAQ